MNRYRCETCENAIRSGKTILNCKLVEEAVTTNCGFCGGNISLIPTLGCASHSDFQNKCEQIKPGDRRTCKFQEIETYPSDEFVYCKSSDGCKFQCLSRVGIKVFCDKSVLSRNTILEQTARQDERKKVLDELKGRLGNLKTRTGIPYKTISFFSVYQIIEELQQGQG